MSRLTEQRTIHAVPSRFSWKPGVVALQVGLNIKLTALCYPKDQRF